MEVDWFMKYQLLGDHVLIISYEPHEREGYPEIAGSHFNYLRRKLSRGVIDIVLCYSSIGVYFDNAVISPFEVEACVRSLLKQPSGCAGMAGEDIIIPVYYGGEFGPDLEKMAQHLNVTCEEVIHNHCSQKYTVFGIGFLPGFPYMGPLPEKLVIPRKAVPAPNVPAGSIAVAGRHTGIYPFDSPGGWHVIGWTPVKMFDVNQPTPSFLKPGDTVTFSRR